MKRFLLASVFALVAAGAFVGCSDDKDDAPVPDKYDVISFKDALTDPDGGVVQLGEGVLVGDISHFVALRFVQGFAGAGGVVLSRSVATDLYQGHELASMLAMIGAVNGIATVLAPVGGGLLSVNAGWKGIFCFLLALGVLLLAGCLRFRESLPTERRLREGWRQVPRHFGIVLHNRRFVLYILQ